MQENIQNLIKLIQENPNLPIIPLVENDAICDEGSYSVASFGKAYLDEYAIYNDEYYDDIDSFKEEYYDCYSDELCKKFNYNPTLPDDNEENNRNWQLLDEYLDTVADQYFNKAILVYIRSYDGEEW